jgi:hypothetical protein
VKLISKVLDARNWTSQLVILSYMDITHETICITIRILLFNMKLYSNSSGLYIFCSAVTKENPYFEMDMVLLMNGFFETTCFPDVRWHPVSTLPSYHSLFIE